ncbi:MULTISPECIES: glycine oxidase ThiO [Prochlorococcus]|uniref:glycine oxidase n=1 Tax=Prochlorococcus marinus (strain SARG / CCMP1375 / SS120) TaxID=167539 RepID=Q7VEG2_PROMA|nr:MULTISPECIES: glycine oxidase ThiO [Prochlorococcus]AAP99097.1 Glycine/D-amino acid oxidase family enzyme [Prochlorococcus marinus subsp. marinus str. CCMP1375]KGG11645.1 Glycine oxidase ThiO [Prochlorococcus marinus str. LG]KGG22347.1 Glycine oxidase ThiO [Prochlorococcus marinus str. SS2]KGG22682.1 Glycine oxidase ThiO [Prochlorococcus marinus str. SS35]KGG32896.1 Glycine oxidase ThiO [Prochlorococcus marinus str. SS51]
MAQSNAKPLLILGGGLIGLSLAHSLAKKGRSVEVLSRNRNEAAGFVAAGMLAPHAEGLNGQLLQLGLESLNGISNWVKTIETDSGMSCGLRQCGIVVPFVNSEDRNNYSTASLGIHLNHKELKKEIPGIASKWKAGLLFKQDGQIDNRRKLMRALEKACVELGVRFQEGIEVIRLIKDKNVFEGVLIKTAEGKNKKISAKQAVLCSGAWSSQLLNEIPIYPLKGQMFSIQGPKYALKRILFGPGIYLVPREDGLIVVGATSEKDAGFTEGLTPNGQIELQEGVNALLPIARSWPHMERWWGFRPCTPDEAPILGKSSLKGLWIATGHHRNGVLLATITSQLITKSICNEELTKKEHDLLMAFQWNRFKTN